MVAHCDRLKTTIPCHRPWQAVLIDGRETIQDLLGMDSLGQLYFVGTLSDVVLVPRFDS